MNMLQIGDNGPSCPFIWQEYRIFSSGYLAGFWGVWETGSIYQTQTPQIGAGRLTIFVIPASSTSRVVKRTRESRYSSPGMSLEE
jgi:hypothetical protein